MTETHRSSLQSTITRDEVKILQDAAESRETERQLIELEKEISILKPLMTTSEQMEKFKSAETRTVRIRETFENSKRNSEATIKLIRVWLSSRTIPYNSTVAQYIITNMVNYLGFLTCHDEFNMWETIDNGNGKEQLRGVTFMAGTSLRNMKGIATIWCNGDDANGRKMTFKTACMNGKCRPETFTMNYRNLDDICQYLKNEVLSDKIKTCSCKSTPEKTDEA